MQNNQDNLSRRLFGDLAVMVTADIADYRDSLHPSELSIVEDAIEKRIFEFSTGRYCAHQALKVLGTEDIPITRGKQREPLWPQNYIGSISHCRDIAGAAVANIALARSIGLDIENRKQINPKIARHVCTEQEERWLNTLSTPERNDYILRIFSIKEAVFKCIYQASGTHLGFKQCQVVCDTQCSMAQADIQASDLSLQKDELTVYSQLTETHVYSSAIWHHLPAVG